MDLLDKCRQILEENNQETKNLETWVVGGAVRDDLLDKKPKDIDFIVIDETEESIKDRGFNKIEAQSFPVFQDSLGHEYSLPRTEESTGEGYHDFKIQTENVTLQEDLKRRDFTINALARRVSDGAYEYPAAIQENPGAHSIKDLNEGIIRHITNAFGDDPVRILRMARFAARYDFQVAKDTMQAARENRGKLEKVPGERIGAEIIKAMKEAKDVRAFFEVLRGCKALNIIMPNVAEFPEISAGPEKYHQEEDLWEHTMMTMEEMQKIEPNNPDLLLMALVHDIGKVKNKDADNHGKHPKTGIPLIKQVCDRLKFGNDRTQKLVDSSRQHMRIHNTPMSAENRMTEKKVLDLIENLDHEKGASLDELIKLCKADAKGRKPPQEIKQKQIRKRLEAAREVHEKVDAEYSVKKRNKTIKDYEPENIGQMIIADKVEMLKEKQGKKSKRNTIKEKITGDK